MLSFKVVCSRIDPVVVGQKRDVQHYYGEYDIKSIEGTVKYVRKSQKKKQIYKSRDDNDFINLTKDIIEDVITVSVDNPT